MLIPFLVIGFITVIGLGSLGYMAIQDVDSELEYGETHVLY